MGVDAKIAIIPAIMSDSYEDVEKKVATVADGVSWVQVDVMDGKFVPSTSWPSTQGGSFVQHLPLTRSIHYGIHLMVENPRAFGENFLQAGATRIIAHIESFADIAHATETLSAWRKAGAGEVGISLLLTTELDVLYPLIDEDVVDVVQVMGIRQIGYQGNPFDTEAIGRVQTLRKMYPRLTITVDGGVKEEHILPLIDAGVDALVMGSAIFETDFPLETIESFKKVALLA